MGDLPAQNNQELVSDVKQRLEGWREVILPLHSVLLWKNPWHTVILFGGISYLFLMIWWCDLSLISLFSIIGAIITLVDYIGPIAIRTISDPSKWNSKKDKSFDDICKSIVSTQITWTYIFHRICDLKTNQPLLYYLAAVIILLTLAFIGQVIDNLLLTYLLVMVLLLIPGLRHNNPIKNCLPSIFGSSGSQFGKKGKNKGN